ncbi:MAG: bifunctional diguanylate cyclase/phosphodiesterase [Pseudomonadota bacterium]
MRSSSPVADPLDRSEIDHLMEAAGDLALRVDLSGQVRRASRRAHALLGAADALAGTMFTSLAIEHDQAALRNAVNDAGASTAEAAPLRVSARLSCPGGDTWFDFSVARIEHPDGSADLLVIGRDMSSQHAAEERLRHLATHDALTGLPNRLLLSDRIRMVLSQSRRSGQGFAVVSIGLDSFKRINEALGNPAGDAVLCMAAARLRKALRDSDTLARVGGDEFVAILPGTATEAQIRLVTGRLLAVLQPPCEIDSHTIYVGASIGVSIFPEHAEDEVRLVALADVALARAKDTGKARCELYSTRQNTPQGHDISLEAAMYRSLREGEFLLFYQPIVEAATRRIHGFETLMRWKHPTLGMVPPVRFIPIAETNGLINLLGAWALKSACVQLQQFEQAAGRPLYMSVNISPRQFRNDKFLDVLDDALAYSGLDGAKLVLEITEGTLMVDPLHAETILERMTERKARIAIDDFGTGYSSLAYLKRFPISVLKVDRAFIKDLPESQKDAAICNAVFDLARHMELSVVAEGVETEEQFRFLEQRGCQYVQGFLTGRPMSANVAMTALKDPFDHLREGLG